ncbi:MAG: multiheme c-type cytochrome [Pirellulaceae bacterium]
MRRKRSLLVLGTLAILGVAIMWSFFAQPPDPGAVIPLQVIPADESTTDTLRTLKGAYVGSQACAECHAEIAASYAAHPMAFSTRRIEQDHWGQQNVNLPAWVPGARRVLTAHMQGAQLVHSEKMFDGDGAQIYELNKVMDYVVGSGQRGRAYLETRGKFLFMSPLNWYSQNEQWSLAPNYQPDDVRRFDRRANEDCLACHAGRVASVRPNSNAYQDPPFHEMAIGCERCHGPGADHIAAHHAGLETQPDPIINPSNLEHERSESLCYQCHLQLRPKSSGQVRVIWISSLACVCLTCGPFWISVKV